MTCKIPGSDGTRYRNFPPAPRRRGPALGAVLLAALAASAALATPPAASLAFACKASFGGGSPDAPLADTYGVAGTLSWIGAIGTWCSIDTLTSAAPPCPPPPYVGPVPGAFCGPWIPPGTEFTCDWTIVRADSPNARLVVGFESRTMVGGAWDGNVGPADATGMGEPPDGYASGPFGEGAWRMANPATYDIRVIAYPAHEREARLSPGDLHLLNCA